MKVIENKEIAASETASQYEPHKLYDLWSMISFLAGELLQITNALDFYQKRFGGCASKGKIEVADDEKEGLFTRLDTFGELCKKLGFIASKDHGACIQGRLIGDNSKCHYRMISLALEDLSNSIKSELSQKQFAFIPERKIPFFEQHDLFGEQVSAAFPSAQSEIKDAGNCLAADLPTAAIFHLMRAAEHGLRGLAKHLRVKVGKSLEYATWEQVIRGIDRKLERLRAKPRGKKKSEALEFYRLTLSECEMLKDVWRNPVSHARGRYSEDEALAVLGRVREFMQRLSERVKESH